MKKIKNLLAITIISLVAFSCNKKGDCVCHVPDKDAYVLEEEMGVPTAEDENTLVFSDREEENCKNIAESDNNFSFCKLRK